MDTVSGAPVPPGGTPVRVAVAADHALVVESVGAALATLGFAPVPVGRRPRPGPRPDVGVLVSELDRPDRVAAAQELVGGDVPWLVLTGVVQGPSWGAVYERGAALVVPSSAGLHEVEVLIRRLAAGHLPAARGPRHDELVGTWRRFAQRRAELGTRLGTLSRREDQVLVALSDGLPVREIAQQGQVSESTVRSQVKAILRKLRVTSQLAAVAAYREVGRDAARTSGQSPGGGAGQDTGDRAPSTSTNAAPDTGQRHRSAPAGSRRAPSGPTQPT